MTNVRRPFHLQLIKPTSFAPSSVSATSQTPATCSQTKPLSPTGDSLPSEILPHLFVGNLEQTNRETLNRLNISYILSLGLLPLISNSASPTSPTTNTTNSQVTTSSQYSTTNSNNNPKSPKQQQQQQQHNNILMPLQNSSKDFKIRIRCSNQNQVPSQALSRDENKGIKTIRTIHCKCINISDNSEQSLSKFFDEAHIFINEAKRKKCNILVHCLAGISRSPTIAIAYLMRYNSLRLQDAYNLVKQRRPQIDPNLSFMGQLMLYERSLDHNRNNNIANSNNDILKNTASLTTSTADQTTISTPTTATTDHHVMTPS